MAAQTAARDPWGDGEAVTHLWSAANTRSYGLLFLLVERRRLRVRKTEAPTKQYCIDPGMARAAAGPRA